jgi:dolichol-phosphate mannosyltransferase
VLPTFNEVQNIEQLVPQLLALPHGLRVLVVDDNSPDGTGEVADALARDERRVHVLHRPARLGIGSAYVAGFQRALAEGFERVVTMDADWSHDPSYLPVLVAPTDTHDLVVGSRYLHGISVVNWSLARLVLSSAGNAYVRAITRLPLRDCTSGFQCIRTEALARIGLADIRTNGYSFLVEVKYRLARRGCSMTEVPIVFTERRHGRTKLTREQIMLSLLNVWRLRLGLYRG